MHHADTHEPVNLRPVGLPDSVPGDGLPHNGSEVFITLSGAVILIKERSLKITAAKVFVSCPGRNFVTLKISTDEGVYGLGDATLNGRWVAGASYLTDYLIPCLVGRRVFQTDD